MAVKKPEEGDKVIRKGEPGVVDWVGATMFAVEYDGDRIRELVHFDDPDWEKEE